jgi:hypothetical protein
LIDFFINQEMQEDLAHNKMLEQSHPLRDLQNILDLLLLEQILQPLLIMVLQAKLLKV